MGRSTYRADTGTAPAAPQHRLAAPSHRRMLGLHLQRTRLASRAMMRSWLRHLVTRVRAQFGRHQRARC